METTTPSAVYLPITCPIFTFACGGNGMLTVLICVERFVMIMYPEKSKIWCSKRKTIMYICVASLTSLLFSIPYSFAYSWDENGKVKPTDTLPILNVISFFAIFLFVVGMLTLSIIITIKVSLYFIVIRWSQLKLQENFMVIRFWTQKFDICQQKARYQQKSNSCHKKQMTEKFFRNSEKESISPILF